MTTTEARHIRTAVRHGNRMLRLRRELRQLDDQTLARRLGKYLGRTLGEVRNEYHRFGAWKVLDRDRVIDRIVGFEVI